MFRIIVTLLVLSITQNLFAQHTLVLKSGESMKGEVLSMKEGSLMFSFKGNSMSFKTSEISVIYFDDGAIKTGSKPETPSSGNSGSVSAGGYQYSVPGRIMIKDPAVNNLTQDKGTVVVDIMVDKYGNVMKAEPGATGTNTSNTYLHTMAKKAAESAKFDTSPTMPLQTKGTLTIIF